MTAPGLVLSGKCYGRNAQGRPYRMDDGREGVSFKARVGLGGGEFLDVKIRDDHALLSQVPTKEDVGPDGVDVVWNLRMSFGKLSFDGVAESTSTRALRPAASS